MTRLRATLITVLGFLAPAFSLHAQLQSPIQIEGLTPEHAIEYSRQGDIARGTHGIVVKYEGTILIADSAEVSMKTWDAVADGHVRIQQGDQVWTGDHILYNFKTRQMITDRFRSGKTPVFAEGEGLHGDITNRVYNATNSFLTTDDISNPAMKLRARRIRIIPGERIEAHDAVLYLGDVPVFYFPYYERNLGERANNFNFVPGYRSSFGPFVLGTYTWFLNDYVDGRLHVDYRERRGIGAGPDINYHFGRWGEGTLRYYYLNDQAPGSVSNQLAAVTNLAGFNLPQTRQRVYFTYLANPTTNFSLRSVVRYDSDSRVVHDFFPGEYRQNPQPNTYLELNQTSDNWSLDVLAQPRVNDFLETVERLPDMRLTGFRQEIGTSPLYYESESSLGYYRREFADMTSPWFLGTNALPHFEAARADTFHQVTLPETFFGWLNFTPRVGGRFTYYSEATGPGATTDEKSRTVFNTGAEVSFKASRLWAGTRNGLLDLDGVRHILQPSVNYVYVPRPGPEPEHLPQFDYESPSLRLLPIEYPDYNAIDSINGQNVLRFGLRNTLQTKRNGKVEDFVDWQLYTDWNLRPHGTNQFTFSDLYSDLTWKPRSWMSLESQTRYDINDRNFRMLLHMLTLQPNTTWNWTIGHYYLRDDNSGSPVALGQGNNLIINALFYRLNENWGFRATQHYDVRAGRMQEHYYTVYRDLRSWTAALSLGWRNNSRRSDDFTVAFTFSLKAMPRFGLGTDTVRPYSLLGGSPN